MKIEIYVSMEGFYERTVVDDILRQIESCQTVLISNLRYINTSRN